MNHEELTAHRRHQPARVLAATMVTVLALSLLVTGASEALLPQTASERPAAAMAAAPYTYVFQRWVSPNASYAGVADTHTALYEPDTNFGGIGTLRLHPNSDGRERILIKFDISQIDPSTFVAEAKLNLYAWYRTETYGVEAHAYRVRRNWNEGQATWNRASAGNLWEAAGGKDPLSDFDPSSVATATLSYTSQWYTWDVTAMARDWVANPATNQGVLIVAEGLGNHYQFRSSEIPSTNLRPYLEVTVDAEGPTPTQTTTAVETYTVTPTSTATPTTTSTPTKTTSPGFTPTVTPTPTRVAAPVPREFQQGLLPDASYAGAEDTFLSWYRPDVSWAHDDSLRASGRDAGSERPLLRFELDGYIPSNAQIHSAKLSLYAWSRRTLYGLRISAYEVLRPWDVGEASWYQAAGAQPWGLAGCNQAGLDRAPEAAAWTMATDSCPDTAPVTRSCSSWASSTTTTSYSGKTARPSKALTASMAWLVTTTSASAAS